ncbi:hypothetical protein [Segnochrobactrum spirostomi]|uniref:hypothetical protein n=1 Tax=Segnochrobactrum spirostomi TaxID=2608987 RepID=UPI0012960979|nr:hypothetical protein [Segnochrobactrum spirostomi]
MRRRRNPGFSAASASSRGRASIAGWCHPRRSPFLVSIGTADGVSVFCLPLAAAIGITKPVACPIGFLDQRVSTTRDGQIASLGWMDTPRLRAARPLGRAVGRLARASARRKARRGGVLLVRRPADRGRPAAAEGTRR